MTSPAVRGLRAALAGLCLGACEAEPPHLGERVDFVFETDEHALCLGTTAHLDDFIEQVFAFFGAAPGSFVVPVDVVAEVSCGGRVYAGGCYSPNEARVTVSLERFHSRPLAVLRHEVSHAIIDNIWGWSVPFFAEGLAESLSRSETAFKEWTPKPRPVLRLLDSPADQLDYEAAALFTRYLIDRVGIANFRAIYQGARGGTRDEIVAVIENGVGDEFGALEADFLSGAPRCTFAVDVCASQDAVEVQAGASWSTSFAASCLAPEFYGTQSSDGIFAATQLRLALQGAGRYRVHIVGGGEFDSFELTRCGDCGQQFVRQLHIGLELELEPGAYAVELVVKPSAHYVEFGLEYLGPPG